MVECSFQTKWLWVRVPLMSLKRQMLCPFQAKSSLIFRQLTIERRFTLKRGRDMIITYNNKNLRQVSFYRTHHGENKVLPSSVTGKNASVLV